MRRMQAILAQPGQGPLHHPALGQRLEAMPLMAFDHPCIPAECFLREGSQARTCHLRDSPALMRSASAHSWRKWIGNRRKTGAIGGVWRCFCPCAPAYNPRRPSRSVASPACWRRVRLEGAVSPPSQRRSPADERVVSFFLAFRQARAGIGGFSLFFIKERPAI